MGNMLDAVDLFICDHVAAQPAPVKDGNLLLISKFFFLGFTLASAKKNIADMALPRFGPWKYNRLQSAADSIHCRPDRRYRVPETI
jgi:hypothetical protein